VTTLSKTIENPKSGERITFRKVAEGTPDERFEGEILLAPRGYGPPEHVHPIIREVFVVRAGTLSASVGGQRRTVGPGEKLEVAPGVPHRWWNETDEPVELSFVVQPALPLDRFLESVFALVHLSKSDERGVPGPLRMSRILQRHWDVVHLARPPLAVQKLVMAVLGVVALLLGYPAEYRYPYPR
jgi:mannose-6-phosphate isomerase-like protein (cupin superfamily)